MCIIKTVKNRGHKKMVLSNVYGETVTIMRTLVDSWKVSEDQGRFEMEFQHLRDALDYARKNGFDEEA